MAVTVIRDDLWLCDDCALWAVNGDASGIDGERCAKVQNGVARLGSGLVPDFDSETDDGVNEFSAAACDACGTPYAGTRHRFAVLSNY